MQWREDGQFVIKLPDSLPPGQYTVILGIFLDGNALQPSAKVLRVRVGAAGCARLSATCWLVSPIDGWKWIPWSFKF